MHTYSFPKYDVSENTTECCPRFKPDGWDEQEQLQRVKHVFRTLFDRSMAVNLEACLRCGMCAEVCHFYEATQIPEYAPVHKFAPLRNFYRREISPMRWLFRFFTPELSIEQLKKWQP